MTKKLLAEDSIVTFIDEKHEIAAEKVVMDEQGVIYILHEGKEIITHITNCVIEKKYQ